MKSTPGVRSNLFPRPLDKTLLTDFFGGVSQAEVVAEEDIESHMGSRATEKMPHPSAGERKPKAVEPSSLKVNTLGGSPPKRDVISSATIRAWAGAGLLGLVVAWIAVGTRSS